jgi:hypothetical protein
LLLAAPHHALTMRKQARRDMTMKMTKPSKFHKKLEAMIGDWSGDEIMHASAWEPQGGSATGRYKVRSIAGGFGIVQEYEQKRGGKVTFTGHSVLGYDEKEKCYLWHWSDSMGGVPATVTRGKWSGNKLVFEHCSEMGHARYTHTFHRDGSIGFVMESSPDGQQWSRMMEGRYTNKAQKAPEKKATKKATKAKK